MNLFYNKHFLFSHQNSLFAHSSANRNKLALNHVFSVKVELSSALDTVYNLHDQTSLVTDMRISSVLTYHLVKSC